MHDRPVRTSPTRLRSNCEQTQGFASLAMRNTSRGCWGDKTWQAVPKVQRRSCGMFAEYLSDKLDKLRISRPPKRTENPRVGGSIPPLGTIEINHLTESGCPSKVSGDTAGDTFRKNLWSEETIATTSPRRSSGQSRFAPAIIAHFATRTRLDRATKVRLASTVLAERRTFAALRRAANATIRT